MSRQLGWRSVGLVLLALSGARPEARAEADWPVVLSEDFSGGPERWEVLDPAGWKIAKKDGNAVFSQFTSESKYEPPYRSPWHVALLKEPAVGDFQLTAKVHSTKADYPHRDACLFFGYQDPAHFYYVHFGKSMDPNANQIFIVDGAARRKISLTTSDGTPWTDEWHTVRVKRSADDIAVYFDDLETPIMTAKDATFGAGRVGIGSFDDTADWDEVELRGVVAK